MNHHNHHYHHGTTIYTCLYAFSCTPSSQYFDVADGTSTTCVTISGYRNVLFELWDSTRTVQINNLPFNRNISHFIWFAIFPAGAWSVCLHGRSRDWWVDRRPHKGSGAQQPQFFMAIAKPPLHAFDQECYQNCRWSKTMTTCAKTRVKTKTSNKWSRDHKDRASRQHFAFG